MTDEQKNKNNVQSAIKPLKANPKRKPEAAGTEFPLVEKSEMGEFAKTAIIAVLLALIIRSFLYEPFNIPSGSMLPTLLVGDYLFVSKPAYGYSQYSFPFGIAKFEGRMMEEKPKRGDVIVFKLPSNPSIDYIKRLVGMPGETVQVINGRLYINGELVEREIVGLVQSDENSDLETREITEYIETLPGGIMHSIYEESDNEDLDNTKLYTVPEGHYFMMGDNRQFSHDSRKWDPDKRFVPYEYLLGKAMFVWMSCDEVLPIIPVCNPIEFRWNRFFHSVH